MADNAVARALVGACYAPRIVQPQLTSLVKSRSEEADRQLQASGENAAALVGSDSGFVVEPVASGWAKVAKMTALKEAGEEWKGLGDGVSFPKVGERLIGTGVKLTFTMTFSVPTSF